MATDAHETIFVRIIELPSVRMARSGQSDLGAFDQWWSALAAQDKHSLFPRDFMWFNILAPEHDAQLAPLILLGFKASHQAEPGELALTKAAWEARQVS